MKRFIVLLEVLYQLVVGIGSYSEATLGTRNFFRHTYRVLKGPTCQFNICHLGFSSWNLWKEGLREGCSFWMGSPLSWQLSWTSVLGTGDSWVIKRGLVPIAWKAADPRAFWTQKTWRILLPRRSFSGSARRSFRPRGATQISRDRRM